MRLWTTTQPVVSNFVHAMVRERVAAQDVLQETALILFRRFQEYDDTRPFIAWALGIARLQVMAARRDGARSRVAFDDSVLAQITETWAELAPTVSEREAWLQDCLQRLGVHARQIVQLRYFEDLTAEEIGKRLNTSGAHIRVTLQRIRDQLRGCIERQRTLERGNA